MFFHVVPPATTPGETGEFEGTLDGEAVPEYHGIAAAITAAGQHRRIVQHSLYAAGIALYHGHLPTTAGELRVCTRR